MTTTFLLTNVQTQLVLNAPFPEANFQTPSGEVVQLDSNTQGSNSFWRFQLSADNTWNTFQIVNAQTQMALGVQSSNSPTWPGSAQVKTPVMEVPIISPEGQLEPSPPYPMQEWTIRPPMLGSDKFNIPGSFELIVSPFDQTNVSKLNMNAPGHLLSSQTSKNIHVPIQVSPGNGGKDNEVWTFSNTAGNSAPVVLFTGSSQYTDPTDFGTNLNFEILNFSEPGARILTLVLPSEQFGLNGEPVGFSGQGQYTTPVAGENSSIATIQISNGILVEGPRPSNANVTVAVVNSNGYIVALTFVSSDWWYSGVEEN